MRMGVPNREWKIDDGNSDFDLCDTYPPLIYVPASATKAMLIGSSRFRSRGRLPVLTYFHSNGVRDAKKLSVFAFDRICFSGVDYALFAAIIWIQCTLSRG